MSKTNDIKTRKGAFNTPRVSGNVQAAKPQRTAEKKPVKNPNILTPVVINEAFRANAEPTIVNGWKIWVNHKDRIICSPAEPNTDRRYRTFGYEPGILFISDNVENGSSIVYFRTDKFQSFINNFGIDKVSHMDPNTYVSVYEGPSKDGKIIYAFSISTDGNAILIDSVPGSDQVKISLDKYPNTHFSIQNATAVVLDKVTKTDAGAIVSTSRCLVTNTDIFTIEETVATLCKSCDDMR